MLLGSLSTVCMTCSGFAGLCHRSLGLRIAALCEASLIDLNAIGLESGVVAGVIVLTLPRLAAFFSKQLH